MACKAPSFWYENIKGYSTLMAPAAWIYAMVANHRLKNAQREKVGVPVLCVGNFTAGGTGKTPLSIAIAKSAIAMGLVPGFLTRGYGGTVSQPMRVDIDHHNARYVGDEPLLLAKIAPTIICANKSAGAKKIIDEGVDIIIMDDGFQSARLWFDLSVLVVDALRGLGNGKIIPAGPVRAPIKTQMLYTDALTIVGRENKADQIVHLAKKAEKPVHYAILKPVAANEYIGMACLAFAAIGHPEKFFKSLIESGAKLEICKSFADHHYFTDQEADELISLSETLNLTLVTTAKDMVRLQSAHGRLRELAAKTKVLDIEIEFDDTRVGQLLVEQVIENFKNRQSL